MMEKIPVIVRYLISTICILLLLTGCDRSAGKPARAKVVRKKIAVPQKKTVTVRKTQTTRVAKATPSVGGQQSTGSPKRVLTAKSNPKANGRKPLGAQPSKSAVPAGTGAVVYRGKAIKPAPAPRSEISPVTPTSPAGRKTASSGGKARTSAVPASGGKLLAGAAGKGVFKLLPDGNPPLYDPAGKIDPFEPLFQEKAVAVKKSKRKKREPRTPLERIALSQLKLVGIILAASGNRALVEESSGKGYIIKKGTYVGTNAGKVVQIKKQTVIVEEEFEDVFGKTKTRQKALKLPKPPGEL